MVNSTQLVNLELLVTIGSLVYVAYLFVLSRRPRAERLPVPDGLFFVFMVPCLNEELVIGASLERLLAIPYENCAVMVIDDGSDDATATIVESYDSDRVWLFRRTAPNARQGKGHALNAAYNHLLTSDLLRGRDPSQVVVAIVDADGRIDPQAVYEVAPHFADPKVAAAQIGVRMYNAGESLLARMQDAEFTIFTEIYQRARVRVGSTGLGGNGQFNRLSALMSLGPAPWTDCLTEDLDMGIRLLAAGWSNVFVPNADVSQQAVTSIRRLVRQRARWFQGHLQCWRLIGLLLRSQLPVRATIDIVYHLTAPFLVLAMSLPMAGYLIALGWLAAHGELASVLFAHDGSALLAGYLIAFGITPLFAFAYWLKNPGTRFVRCLFYAHVYALYAYMWIPAGWMAVWRVITGKRGWAKTARTADSSAGGTLEVIDLDRLQPAEREARAVAS